MSNLQREATLFIDTPYRPDAGQFCKPKGFRSGRYEAGTWHRCREVWHNYLKNLNLFFYSHDTGKTRAIAAFMGKIETILDIHPRSHFGPTQRKTICWVEPSAWWTRLAMRRSLFTILLRAGHSYKIDDDNFEQALYSHRYAEETWYAVQRFLAGNTTYTGRRRGWYNQFYVLTQSPAEIDKLLIRREK